jgi:magnesium transporter
VIIGPETPFNKMNAPFEQLSPEPQAPADHEAAAVALARVQTLLIDHPVLADLGGRDDLRDQGLLGELIEQLVLKYDFKDLREALDPLHPADVAFVLEALPRNERLVVFELIKASLDGDVLLQLSEPVRESVIASMDTEELVDAVESLDADEIADLAPDLPPEVVEEVSEGLDPEEREQLRTAMSYPEESVGARMDFDLIKVRADLSLEVVLRYLRRFDALPDHTDKVFVVDGEDNLLGTLSLDRLLVNEPEVMVEDVMARDVMTLNALDEASEAAKAFQRYDLVSAPVVAPGGRLIGRLTIAAAVDVIQEEGDADILNQAGLREDEDLFASVWASAKNRWLWLGLNLCTAFFASRVIGAFEGTISKVVALAALMPIVAGIAGNSGNQTMTLVIRSLALGQTNASNARRLIIKELAIAGTNGVMWGTLAGLFAWWLYNDSPFGMTLGFTMMLAMILNLLLGAVVGMVVPLGLQRLGRDPAMGSSVLLTFSTDSMGFFIFLGLATLFFR